MPYPDVKRWYYTQNDAFNLMLRLDRALPLTGSDRNPYHATISTFVYALKKSLDKYLVRGVRDGAPRFSE